MLLLSVSRRDLNTTLTLLTHLKDQVASPAPLTPPATGQSDVDKTAVVPLLLLLGNPELHWLEECFPGSCALLLGAASKCIIDNDRHGTSRSSRKGAASVYRDFLTHALPHLVDLAAAQSTQSALGNDAPAVRFLLRFMSLIVDTALDFPAIVLPVTHRLLSLGTSAGFLASSDHFGMHCDAITSIMAAAVKASHDKGGEAAMWRMAVSVGHAVVRDFRTVWMCEPSVPLLLSYGKESDSSADPQRSHRSPLDGLCTFLEQLDDKTRHKTQQRNAASRACSDLCFELAAALQRPTMDGSAEDTAVDEITTLLVSFGRVGGPPALSKSREAMVATACRWIEEMARVEETAMGAEAMRRLAVAFVSVSRLGVEVDRDKHAATPRVDCVGSVGIRAMRRLLMPPEVIPETDQDVDKRLPIIATWRKSCVFGALPRFTPLLAAAAMSDPKWAEALDNLAKNWSDAHVSRPTQMRHEALRFLPTLLFYILSDVAKSVLSTAGPSAASSTAALLHLVSALGWLEAFRKACRPTLDTLEYRALLSTIFSALLEDSETTARALSNMLREAVTAIDVHAAESHTVSSLFRLQFLLDLLTSAAVDRVYGQGTRRQLTTLLRSPEMAAALTPIVWEGLTLFPRLSSQPRDQQPYPEGFSEWPAGPPAVRARLSSLCEKSHTLMRLMAANQHDPNTSTWASSYACVALSGVALMPHLAGTVAATLAAISGEAHDRNDVSMQVETVTCLLDQVDALAKRSMVESHLAGRHDPAALLLKTALAFCRYLLPGSATRLLPIFHTFLCDNPSLKAAFVEAVLSQFPYILRGPVISWYNSRGKGSDAGPPALPSADSVVHSRERRERAQMRVKPRNGAGDDGRVPVDVRPLARMVWETGVLWGGRLARARL